MLVGILDHDDDGIDHGSDGDGNAAQRHDVGAEPLGIHHDEGDHHRDREDDNGNQGAPEMQQEEDANQGDYDAFLDELLFQGLHRAVDQRRPVVGDRVMDIRREPLHGLVQLRLHIANDLPGVGSVTDHDDAADGFPFAIELRDAPPHLGSELDVGDLAEKNRDAVGAAANRDLLQVVNALDVAFYPEDELLFGHLDGAPADFAVAALDGLADVGDGDVVGAQLGGIDGDLVLLDVAADGSDLGDALHGGELVFHIPILDRAQLGQVLFLGVERVHERPADPGGVRPQRRGDSLRHLRGERAEIL